MLNIQLYGLDVRIIFDKVFGLAYLSKQKVDQKQSEIINLSLSSLHINLKENHNINDLLLELYSED